MDHFYSTNAKDLQAIQMKYAGVPYRAIARAVKVEYATVKAWFMTSGRLYKAYNAYATAENEDKKLASQQTLASNLSKAVAIMTELLNSPNEKIRFMVAKDIIDRQIIPKNTVIPQTNEIKILDMMEAVKRLRREGFQLK